MRFFLKLFYIVTLVFGMISVAEAGVIVSPVQLTVAPSNPIALLTLTNSDPTPVTFQIQSFHWTQKNGLSTLTPVNNLIVSPPIFTLPGKGSQLIRLGFLNLQPTTQEQTYRVLVRQLPYKNLPQQKQMTIQVLLDMSLPLFVAPSAPAQKMLRIHLYNQAGHTYLQFTNNGNVFMNLNGVTIAGTNGKPLKLQPVNNYILANTQQTLTLPANLVHANHPLTLDINTSWQNFSVALTIGQTKNLTAA